MQMWLSKASTSRAFSCGRFCSSSNLVSTFNTPPARNGFNFRISRSPGCLFQIPELRDHTGFQVLRDNVVVKANELVAEATSSSRTRKLVQVFDDLSDELCRVADMADFVRIGHPEAKYREAAEEACIAVGVIVQEMNTNVPLYESLRAVVEEGDDLCSEPYDVTDKRVARLLLNDFEQCGIHLDMNKRKKFVELTEYIMELESSFMQGSHKPSIVNVSCLPSHLHHVFGITKQATVHTINSDHPDGDVREASYRAYLYPSESQSIILEKLLLARDEQAKLVGFTSYAERALQGTMTESPENANRFLELLSRKLMPLTIQDFTKMKIIKEKLIGNVSIVNPWDVSYCTTLARQYSMSDGMAEVSTYLSLGVCMNGLRLLTERLYGITLRDVTPDPSECWNNSIHKIEAHRLDNDELLGVIYCDFFERAGKNSQDCHFTIRGGRVKSDGTYQTPKVVLMMNLSTPTRAKPSLLTPQQLDNLFHEFGHAMHSMIGRTRYQHVTGTRCSTDFAEVPSILMEYFTADSRVLRAFTSHYQTGQPMPEQMAKQIIRSKSLFIASDTQIQVFYSALDQALHSCHPLGSPTIDVLADTQRRYYGLPHVENTAWHLRFGHMVGYGAKYFAYLMSRAIAANIWQHCFKADPFNRENGERYMKEVLEHGGQRPPTDMVESLTGTRPTIEGLVDSLIHETQSAGNYGS